MSGEREANREREREMLSEDWGEDFGWERSSPWEREGGVIGRLIVKERESCYKKKVILKKL